jgi:hypothetical protein
VLGVHGGTPPAGSLAGLNAGQALESAVQLIDPRGVRDRLGRASASAKGRGEARTRATSAEVLQPDSSVASLFTYARHIPTLPQTPHLRSFCSGVRSDGGTGTVDARFQTNHKPNCTSATSRYNTRREGLGFPWLSCEGHIAFT